MTADEMKTLIDDLYLLSATDMDKALELYIHEDFVIEEPAELPMAGTYSGKEGLKSLYASVFTMVDVVALERSLFMAGEDCCATKVEMRFADPNLESAELLEMFKFKNGKVIEIRPYYFSPSLFTQAAKVGS